jgi:hypothetical protein
MPIWPNAPLPPPNALLDSARFAAHPGGWQNGKRPKRGPHERRKPRDGDGTVWGLG